MESRVLLEADREIEIIEFQKSVRAFAYGFFGDALIHGSGKR